jgi:hypothetical protein
MFEPRQNRLSGNWYKSRVADILPVEEDNVLNVRRIGDGKLRKFTSRNLYGWLAGCAGSDWPPFEFGEEFNTRATKANLMAVANNQSIVTV